MDERSKTFLVGGEIVNFLDECWDRMLAQWGLDPRRVPKTFEEGKQTPSQQKRDSQPIVIAEDSAEDFVAFVNYCAEFEQEPMAWRRGAMKIALKVAAWGGVSHFTLWESILANRYLNDRHRLGMEDGTGEVDQVMMLRAQGWRIGGPYGPSKKSLKLAGLMKSTAADGMREAWSNVPSALKVVMVAAGFAFGLTALLWVLMS